jgi:ATP-dependent DNA ligase
MLDGEVLAKSWNRTSSLLRSKRAGMSDAAKAAIVDEVRFAVFDLVDLTLEPRMLKSGPRARKLCSVFAVSLTERRSRLMDLDLEPPLFLAPQTVVSSLAELHEEYEHLLEFGFEGAIVKEPSAYYWPGERGCGWWKMKPSQTMELVIIRCEPGAGKHEGRLGAIVGRRADGVEIAVGTGLTDSQREEFWARREALVGMEMEIKAQAGDVASARHPVFVRIREEKARGRA